MRREVWEKDDFFEIGGKRIDMDPTVVQLLEGEVPLSWGFSYEKFYGTVSDLRLEDGVISGEIHLSEELQNFEELLENDYRLGGHYKEVHYTDDSKTRVSSCSLVGVSLVPKTNMPGFPKEINNG